jgi:ATP-dependent helicase/nuclease subunit B
VAGEEVLVEGTIDRADFIEVDGKERVRIIDYKTGADKLDTWKMRQGVKMQLMIYLISAVTGEMEPAGMFYFNIKDPMESINDKSENSANNIIEREAEDEFKLKGAFVNEEGVLEAMPPEVLASAKNSVSREEYEEIRSDVISRIEETASGILGGKIDIKPLRNDNRLVCSYCSLGSVCRRDRGYVKNSARKIPTKPKEDKKSN